MAKTINTNIDDGFLLFTFTNKQGEVFSSFKLNPTDINIAARAEELETVFEKAQDTKHLRIYSKNQLPQQLYLEMVRCLPISFWTKSMKHLLRKLKRERKKCRKWLINTRRSIQNDRL